MATRIIVTHTCQGREGSSNYPQGDFQVELADSTVKSAEDLVVDDEISAPLGQCKLVTLVQSYDTATRTLTTLSEPA